MRMKIIQSLVSEILYEVNKYETICFSSFQSDYIHLSVLKESFIYQSSKTVSKKETYTIHGI